MTPEVNVIIGVIYIGGYFRCRCRLVGGFFNDGSPSLSCLTLQTEMKPATAASFYHGGFIKIKSPPRH